MTEAWAPVYYLASEQFLNTGSPKWVDLIKLYFIRDY